MKPLSEISAGDIFRCENGKVFILCKYSNDNSRHLLLTDSGEYLNYSAFSLTEGYDILYFIKKYDPLEIIGNIKDYDFTKPQNDDSGLY